MSDTNEQQHHHHSSQGSSSHGEHSSSHSHTHRHKHKHKKSEEDRRLIRKISWRKIKKFIAKVLFFLMCVAAIVVCIYGLYLLLFEPSEPLKEITPQD